MNEKEKIVNKICEVIEKVIEPQRPCKIWWNSDKKSIAPGQYHDGDEEIRPDWIQTHIEQTIKDLELPIYAYVCRDNALVSIENGYLKENHPDATAQQLAEVYEQEQGLELHIGWD